MSSTNKTPHYNLSQFGDSPDDKPSWRGDYTADMSKIDAQMFRNATDATNALNTANGIKSTADNALQLAQTNEDKVAEQASYFNALGVTSLPTAQALMDTINGKAQATALTALQGTVSGLTDTVAGKANSNDVYTKSQSNTMFTKQGGYSGTAQALNNAIQQNATNIAENTSDISLLQAFVREFTNDANWRKTHLQGSIGAFARNMYLMYNETLKMFRVYGFMFQSGTSAGGGEVTGSVSDSSQPQGGLASGYLPESLRPSADYEIEAAGTSYSVQPSNYSLAPLIGSARLRIKTTGQIEFTFTLGGTGSNHYDTTCFFQPCLYFAAIHQ